MKITILLKFGKIKCLKNISVFNIFVIITFLVRAIINKKVSKIYKILKVTIY